MLLGKNDEDILKLNVNGVGDKALPERDGADDNKISMTENIKHSSLYSTGNHIMTSMESRMWVLLNR